MQIKQYNPDGILDKSTAIAGFKRTTLTIPKKKEMVIIGLIILAIAISIALVISYQMLFIVYSIYTIFIFMVYLMLWFDIKNQKKSIENLKKWPTVSLIIPSYNTIHTIPKCIESCKNLEYPNKVEIIVVDDGSTDGSYEMLKNDPSIVLIKKDKNEGKGAALNLGIKKANGEIIGCVDSDSYPHKDTLINAVKYFENDEKIGAVVLFIKTTKPRNFIQAVQEIEYWLACGFFFTTIASIDCLYLTPGPMSLYNANMFRQLGGFDEKNITEDIEIALRMQKYGWKIRTCNTSVVETEVPATLKSLYQQRLRWARGGIMNIMKYTDILFNPKYNAFGLFVFPMILGAGFFTSLFMMWTIFNWLKTFISWIIPLSINFNTAIFEQITIVPDFFLIDSSWMVGIVSFSIWVYFVYTSFEIADEKFSNKYLLPMFGMIYFYPPFIGFVYLTAYLQEIFSRKYSW